MNPVLVVQNGAFIEEMIGKSMKMGDKRSTKYIKCKEVYIEK